ncbi:MAG: hypothetical protein ACOC3D_05005 [Pseudomonadota bacterium]
MRPHRIAAVLALATCLGWAGLMQVSLARGAADGGVRLVVFRPGTDSGTAFGALLDAGGTPIGRTWFALAWYVDLDGSDAIAGLQAAGALWVLPAAPLRQAFAAGCGFGPVGVVVSAAD